MRYLTARIKNLTSLGGAGGANGLNCLCPLALMLPPRYGLGEAGVGNRLGKGHRNPPGAGEAAAPSRPIYRAALPGARSLPKLSWCPATAAISS